MNFKRKEFWIPTVIGLVIVSIVAGILVYRNFFRAEEWRLYDQIRTKPIWVEWVYVKMGWEDDLGKRIEAINVLDNLGGKSLSPLAELLFDRNFMIRYNAVRRLKWSDDKRAVEPLIRYLQNCNKKVVLLGKEKFEYNKDEITTLVSCSDHRFGELNVQLKVIEALAGLGDKRAIKSLIKYTKEIDDENNGLSQAAAEALKKLGHPIPPSNPKSQDKQ